MMLGEAFRTGLREIRAHKVRSALSFFAVSIGVASLLYTFAVNGRMSKDIQQEVDLMGAGRLEIEASRGETNHGKSPGLTLDDAEDIQRSIPGLFMVYPNWNKWIGNLHVGTEKFHGISFRGTTPQLAKRDWVFSLRGRWLRDEDVRKKNRVAVLVEPGGWRHKPFWARWGRGGRPFPKYISHHELLGRELLADGRIFRVVGVLRPPVQEDDNRIIDSVHEGEVIVPITVLHDMAVKGDEHPRIISDIQVDTGDHETIRQNKKLIEALLKRRHKGEEDFRVKNLKEVHAARLAEAEKTARAAMVMGAVAIFSGGIGILNVILAALFSRIKEIGIRRALGATRMDILSQFIAEAVILGLLGGVAGGALGIFGISQFAKEAEETLEALTWWHVLGGVFLGGLSGCVFSVYPAWKAAILDPVEALRHE